MKKKLFDFVKFVLFLSVGLVILFLVYRDQNQAYQAQCILDGINSSDCSLWRKVAADFGRVNYFWIAVIIASFMFSNWSRAARWKMLIEPLGHNVSTANAFWTINLGYFANLGLPRIGEVVRAASMSRYEKIPLEKLIGTIVVDRTLDVLCLLSVVGLAFMLEFDTLYAFVSDKSGNLSAKGGIFHNIYFQAVVVLGIIAVIIAFVFRKRLMESAIGVKVIALAVGFTEGVLSVKSTSNPIVFLLHTINIWLMYYLMAYFCFFSFAPTSGLSPVVALMVYTFGAFGILIPSPGGMGTYHVLVMAALTLYGVNSVDSFSFANIFFFSVNIFGSIAFGLLALVVLPIINRVKA
ncbi:MAG: lysylphosphatidylglycerol synthase transmembrane domain-containing protein [Saprospiraceae bacterium]